MKIYYIGNYSDTECIYRNPRENYAGTMKMKFVIAELKKLGYCVEVVSTAIDPSIGKGKQERIRIDNLEEHYYLPYMGIIVGERYRAAGLSVIRELYKYMNKVLKNDDITIVYHAYSYAKTFDRLKQKKNIYLIKQIEEIYCLSHYDILNPAALKKEERMFANADGYLMINEEIAKKYGRGKPCAISYGNYLVYSEKDVDLAEDDIGIVYTGLISEDRGAFASIEAMKYLPSQYTLHILGFGNSKDMEKMKSLIDKINEDKVRVYFDGTRMGDDYTAYLKDFQIGLSIMDIQDEIANNAFPSKILSYIGNSLLVVASKSKCITNSKLKNNLYYCTDNTPHGIAEGILSIPRTIYKNPSLILENLETDFRNDLKMVLESVANTKKGK